MSIQLRQSALALAVLGGLVASGAAAAFTVTPATTGYSFPYIVGNLTASPSDTIPVEHSVVVATNGSDLILGRTTGFSVRISLAGGAAFAQYPTLGNQTTFTALQTCTGSPVTCTQGGWSVNLTAGGSGQSYAVYSVQPTAAGATIGVGTVLSLNGNTVQLTGVGALATAGGAISSTFSFVDPNTAAQIETPVPVTLLESVDPITFNVNPTGVPVDASAGDYIDVGSNAQIPSKTWFGSNTIGSLLSGTFGAGLITSGMSPAIINQLADLPGFYIDGTNDTYGLTVTGNFAAFTQTGAMVYLDPSGTCGTMPVSGSPLIATVAPNSATFSGMTVADLDGDAGSNFTSTVWSAALCFSVPNGNSIIVPPSQYTAQLSFTGAGVLPGYFPPQTFPYALAGATNTEAAQPLLTMNYNGPVVTVYTVNPAGNSTQQSFLRINNTGSLGGLVTITGVDDAGNKASGQLSFTLPANESIQLNSTVLQNGSSSPINGIAVNGALGTPVGKWVLTVTGQFQGMVVTSLNRNNNSGTLTNLTGHSAGGVPPLGTGPVGQ
jgi:hypothetical protein